MTQDNIKAVITFNAREGVSETDDGVNTSVLDAVLTTLRKHGISPKFFEYEPERDEPESSLPVAIEETRETSYNSVTDQTTVTIKQTIAGSI